MRTVTPFLAVLLLLSSPKLTAQQPPLLFPGMQVRASTMPPTRGPAWMEGSVSRVTDDHLVIDPVDGELLAIPLEFLTRVEIYRRTGSYGTVGAVVGLAGGAFLGLVVKEFGDADAAWVAVGAAAGGVTGFFLGRSVYHEGWDPVSVDAIRGDSASPLENRFTLGLSIRF
jgi:hypothetical protein